ncbi:MAG: transcriptional regulator [Bacteroidaceae bacterium]|nr:transcriptional regulator [Bacteroidaceae bacterium]
MSENIRFIEVIESLKQMGAVSDYVQVAAVLETNKAGISDIKSGRKKLSLEILRRMKLSYPSVNIEWVIMGEGEMFHTQSQPTQTTGFEDKLLNVIQEKDSVIRGQAEEIGQLRERIAQLQREKGKNVSDAQTSDIANVG